MRFLATFFAGVLFRAADFNTRTSVLVQERRFEFLLAIYGSPNLKTCAYSLVCFQMKGLSNKSLTARSRVTIKRRASMLALPTAPNQKHDQEQEHRCKEDFCRRHRCRFWRSDGCLWEHFVDAIIPVDPSSTDRGGRKRRLVGMASQRPRNDRWQVEMLSPSSRRLRSTCHDKRRLP